MMSIRNWFSIIIIIGVITINSPLHATIPISGGHDVTDRIHIGWASADITPDEPVAIAGGSSARIYQDVKDPIGATILLLESVRNGSRVDMVVMISLDLCLFSNELLERVRIKVDQNMQEIDASKIILNATHTHDAPETRINPDMVKKLAVYGIDVPIGWSEWGIDLGIITPGEYVEFAAERITGAIKQAWEERKPGGVSFGLAHAVVGGNRLAAYYDGSSQMYGSTNDAEFSHMEGYEDHSINLLYTWNSNRELTGVIVNTAIPAQAGGAGGKISADYWHETRLELRDRLGEDVYIFAQNSAGGDLSPRMMIDHRAEERMQQLTGRNQREQIAVRLADAVMSILPYMETNIDWNPAFGHRMEQVELTRRRISEDDIKTPRRTFHRPEVESLEESFERLLGEYKKMLKEFEEQPELKVEPNWYRPITAVYWRLKRAAWVLDRYELQKTEPSIPFELHVIRIGDMAIATNPFELYLDFGMQMKARSKAVQTFVVQLAGGAYGTYAPTHRSVAGGGYGAIPQSNQIGPEGGRELVEQTLVLIETLWDGMNTVKSIRGHK